MNKIIKFIFIIIITLQGCKEDKLNNYHQNDIYRLFEEQKDDSLKLVLDYFITKDCVEAIYFKGFCKRFCSNKNKDVDSVKYYMEKAKLLCPKDIQINYILGKRYFEEYNNKKSIECYEFVINNINSQKGNNNFFFNHYFFLKIDYVKLCRGYIYNLVDLKREKDALKFLDLGIVMGGDYLRLYNERSYVKNSLGDSVGAKKDLQMYQKLFPNLNENVPDKIGSVSKRKLGKSYCL